ncbi:MAG: hypothetical protein ABIU30_18470 [Ferruginibacter sp.]
MADEKILAKGLRFFAKHPAQPDFVKGTLVITPNEIVAMCKENAQHMTEYNGEKQLKLQILESKEGKTYATIDTWKKGDAPAPKAATNKTTAAPYAHPADSDDLPF